MAETDQTGTERTTGTVRGMTGRNPENENHMIRGNRETRVMTDPGRESERGTEGIVTRQKRGNGNDQGTERNQKKLIGEVEAETDHLTDGKAESQDILRIVLPRLVHRA